MKRFLARTVLISSLLLTSSAFAQDDTTDDLYHPMMSDTFNLGLGLFWPKKEFSIRVDGRDPGDEIDLSGDFQLDDYETTGNLNFRWRFGEKWSFWGQYWSLSDEGGAVLEEDYEWNDLIFKEGTYATAGLETKIARLFFGRTFFTRPGHEFGLGAGLHWLELEAFLEGQVLTSEGDLVFDRASVDAEFPLPNIGGWYMWSFHKRWMFQARVDWLSATVGDYSGGLWNVSTGFNFQAFKHLGIGLYYNAFILNVDVDKDDWRGKAESDQHGPYLALTGTW